MATMDQAGHRERRPWTDEEDILLREAIVREDPQASPPSKWHAIATHVPNRTNKDCRKRWWAQMATQVSKGGWSAEEDDKLCAAVEQFGTKWALVATMVNSRNSGQCAKRWNDALNPAIDRSEWTDEEDVKLLEAVKTQGKSWTNIVRQCLVGRTGLAAKNRYNHLTRATTDRGRERRKSANATPYSRNLQHMPSTASASAASTPPHMISREHSPLTPADSQPFYAQHMQHHPNSVNAHGHVNAKPEPGADFYPREYDRPTLSLAAPAIPAPQDRLGYSPHLPGPNGMGGMYPPTYRLTNQSPADSPRSAYPGAPGQAAYFPPGGHSQTGEVHRGGYHSGPPTPALPEPNHSGPGYFGAAGVNNSHLVRGGSRMGVPAQPVRFAEHYTSGPGHPGYDTSALLGGHPHQHQQQQQQQQQQQHQHHHQGPGQAPPDNGSHHRLPSMQAMQTGLEQWS